MKSQTLTPFDLFGNQVRYTVPLFQRPYVWTKDKQWEPLWEDVRTVAEKLLEAKEAQGSGLTTIEAIPHFLGAIVLDQKLVPTGFILERQVIDGQQRLTTLQLLLDAAQEVVAAYGTQSDAAALRGLVLNDHELIRTPDQVFKVWPTNYDRDAFRSAMLGESAVDDPEIPSILQAHRYFKDAIREWAEPDGDADSVRVRLNALTSALREYLRLVVIDLERGDNAQVIFETLNYRGTPLLAADLIKNSIFRQAELDGVDVESLYETRWKRFDSGHWRKEIVQGRLRRPRVDVFFNYWLVMRTGREVQADRIFTDFLEYVGTGNADLEMLLEDLNRHAEVFDTMMEGFPPYSVEGSFVYRVLQVLDQNVMAPVLLWLFGQDDGVISEEQLRKALSALESWAVRRMICRWPSRSVSRTVIDLVESIVKVDPRLAGDEVERFLMAREGVAAGWPSDSEVVESLLATPVYRAITRARLRMLLETLEDDRRTLKSEEGHCVRWKLTIEHVMPQGWREHWPLPGVEHPEVESSQRDALIQTIGNLTLVNDHLNPALSNRPWTDAEAAERGLGETGKHSIIDANSVLLLNHDIVSSAPTEWSEASIGDRGLDLAQRVVSIWPRPAMASSQDSQGPTIKEPSATPASSVEVLDRVTLHQELIEILREQGNDWMTTQELADEVNRRGRYHKMDGSEVDAFQIHGRTRKYSHLFERDGSKVRLLSEHAE